LAQFQGYADPDSGNNSGTLYIKTRNGATGVRDTRMTIKYTGNVGIGTTDPGTNKLEVVGGPIKATGGLIIETRTDDPASPVAGQIWLRTDL